MAKVDEWPYDVLSDKNGKRVFTPMTFTIKAVIPAKDVTAKATGRQYHFPPAVTFEEDPMKEEWSLADWVDGDGGKRIKVDWKGIPVGNDENGDPIFELPQAGNRVSVQLKTAEGNGDRVWRDADVKTLVVLNTNIAKINAVNDERPAAPAAPVVGQVTNWTTAASNEPEVVDDFGFVVLGPSDELDNIPEQQRIAGTALTNVLAPKVWDESPDEGYGSEWKTFMRRAVKHYTMLQVPQTLRRKIQQEIDDEINRELDREEELSESKPATDESVEQVDW